MRTLTISKKRLSFSQAHTQCGTANAAVPRPIRNCSPYPVVGNYPISLLIIGLCNPIRPAAIYGIVISVVVNAVNRQPGSVSWQHVRREVCELHPSLANGYAATKIVLGTIVVWVKASSLHCLPHTINAMPVKPVRCSRREREFILETPAGSGTSSNDATKVNHLHCSAVASHRCISRSPRRINRDNHQSSVSLPNSAFRLAARGFLQFADFSHDEPPKFFVVSVHSATTYRVMGASFLAQREQASI